MMQNHHFSLSLLFFFFICCSFNKHGGGGGLLLPVVMAQNSTSTSTKTRSVALVHVGLVLDLEIPAGKRNNASISMALDDFYASHTSYKTRLRIHSRDSKQDVIAAASAAMDLMKNIQAQVIIGPSRSSQAEFIINLGNKTQVPIISFSATSPALAPATTPYFVRTTSNDSSQVAAISAFVKYFGWREVVPVYEDTSYVSGIIPYLVDGFQSIGAKVPYRSIISPSVNDDQLSEELYKLMTMQTRVFIVHMEPHLASRLFSKAKEIGMMEEGYVWIMTDGVGNMLDSLDPRSFDFDAMQGAVAVRSYMPKSKEMENFTRRWKARFQRENPSCSCEPRDPSVFELWAYDTVWALAMAVEKATVSSSSLGKLHQGNYKYSTDLGGLSVSQNGPELLEAILSTKFRGIAGDFVLFNGQINSSVYEIVNVIGKVGRPIAFWTPEFGISKQLNSTSSVSLKAVIWPGDTTSLPKGWEMPRKLKVLVPVKNGFNEFVNIAHDNTINRTSVTGYCIDVFEAAMQLLPYAVSYEYFPYANGNGESAGSYSDMVLQVHLQKYDAVVGDVTIIANRSKYVDFTLSYTESGVSMIVPVKDKKRNMWIFLEPLSSELWLWTLGFFLFIGFILCLIEPRINPEFQGPPLQQLGMIFYFSFSTLTFGHRERLVSNISRIIVLIWVFIVLILISAYTAGLTSLLTVLSLEPAVTDVSELLKNHKSVGYQDGSFVADFLIGLGFKDDQLKNYSSLDQCIEALNKGEVAAIFDDILSLKLFLSHNCPIVTMAGKNVIGKTYKAAHIAMVGNTFKTDGFGFVFPLGSPLARDVSRAILNLTQSDNITTIERKWFGDVTSCLHSDDNNDPGLSNLKFQSFGGLFLITGVVTGLAFSLQCLMYYFQNRDELRDAVADENSVGKKAIAWIKHYDKRKLLNSPSMTSSTTRRIVGVQADTASNLTGFGSPVDTELSYMNGDTLGEGMLSVELGLQSVDQAASDQSTEITGVEH